MRILFINNDGGGFADEIDIADGITVQQLFDQRIKGKSADYLIRVNRQPTPASPLNPAPSMSRPSTACSVAATGP